MNLDNKGRCCGRKPIWYKRPPAHHFCTRCDRAYNEAGEQVENWHWMLSSSGKWIKKPRNVRPAPA